MPGMFPTRLYPGEGRGPFWRTDPMTADLPKLDPGLRRGIGQGRSVKGRYGPAPFPNEKGPGECRGPIVSGSGADQPPRWRQPSVWPFLQIGYSALGAGGGKAWLGDIDGCTRTVAPGWTGPDRGGVDGM